MVRAAADVRDAYALWHYTEDHRLSTPGNPPNTADELAVLESELADLCNRVGLAKSRFALLGATALGAVAESAWGDMIQVLYELREYRRLHPQGGTYDGYRICSLDRHDHRESEFDSALKAYVTTRTQRLRAAARRNRSGS